MQVSLHNHQIGRNKLLCSKDKRPGFWIWKPGTSGKPATKLETLQADIRRIMNVDYKDKFSNDDKRYIVYTLNWNTEAGAEEALKWAKQHVGIK